jgi:hypothetical protein
VALPGWMKDEALLNPLLAAYDTRIAKVGGELRGKCEELQQLRVRTEEVVKENERLLKEISSQVLPCRRQTDGLHHRG